MHVGLIYWFTYAGLYARVFIRGCVYIPLTDGALGMAVGNFSIDFKPVPGVRLGTLACGIKPGAQPDLVLFEFAANSQMAGIFTQNHFAGAPVILARKHLAQQQIDGERSYFLVNSGNANAATGEAGIADARRTCQALSQHTGVAPAQVLPFSTGVIGERLPVEKIIEALPAVLPVLDEAHWLEAARGIMTTDTQPKIGSRQFQLDDIPITITGIAKGAGMLQPDMATLLVYLATDAVLPQAPLQAALQAAADKSFNRITIDGDTSTNDACMLVATGVSGLVIDTEPQLAAFTAELTSLMIALAQGIIRDAEGATKFIEVQVQHGKEAADCLAVARSIANSPLLKTACYGSDANWGRIVMAIGKTAVDLDASKIDLYLDQVRLVKGGTRDPDYFEEAGAGVMAQDKIGIRVDLNQGEAQETLWTSDLSHDYVTINADYRS